MKIINKLHTSLGDLWWYSLMIFLACRVGDVINAFVGLYLIPKYVGTNELGVVLPLENLTGLFTVPFIAFATVFSKYVNTYATHGAYGKVKSFICDVLLIYAVIFLVCIILAKLILPHFYIRLNIQDGFLTILILASSLIGGLSRLFDSALQGLKKFKSMTVVNLIGAPIRLLTMIVAMPYRALSGYVLGQTTPPVATSFFTTISLYKTLKPYTRDSSWRADMPEIIRYFIPILIYTSLATLFGVIVATIYRQRLPEIESSAYYILTRFSEISAHISLSMIVILFPLAAEAHEKGRENKKLLSQTILGILIITILLTALFAFGHTFLFSLTTTWCEYLPYSYLLPLITLNTGLNAIIGMVITYDMACRRFSSMIINITLSLLWTIALVAFAGYQYFDGLLPMRIVDWMGTLHIAQLHKLTYLGLFLTALKLAFIFSPRFRKSTLLT